MELPTFEVYCQNTTGHNALEVDIGPAKVWFSYKTPVAFQCNGMRVVRVNDWGPTTGKHLNAIDGGSKAAKSARVTGTAFETLLADTLASVPIPADRPRIGNPG